MQPVPRYNRVAPNVRHFSCYRLTQPIAPHTTNGDCMGSGFLFLCHISRNKLKWWRKNKTKNHVFWICSIQEYLGLTVKVIFSQFSRLETEVKLWAGLVSSQSRLYLSSHISTRPSFSLCVCSLISDHQSHWGGAHPNKYASSSKSLSIAPIWATGGWNERRSNLSGRGDSCWKSPGKLRQEGQEFKFILGHMKKDFTRTVSMPFHPSWGNQTKPKPALNYVIQSTAGELRNGGPYSTQHGLQLQNRRWCLHSSIALKAGLGRHQRRLSFYLGQLPLGQCLLETEVGPWAGH